MIQLHFVGDGARDHATVPHIVAAILQCKVNASTESWARLHGAGRGYGKKLHYAVAQARDGGAVGLVATIDRDKDHRGERMKSLHDARARSREKNAPFPTALGEAIPHGEAWLLDDSVAIRQALGLPDSQSIPVVTSVSSPKTELSALQSTSTREAEREIDVLGDIARRLVPERCVHEKETGFRAFRREIEAELRPLTESP